MSDQLDLGPVVNARVLIVEDERIIAKDIEQTLRALGYRVIGIVDTGEEAVQRALAERPELVLMDIHLRGAMDGIEAARQIERAYPVPVVFLTAYADEPTLRRAEEVAPYGYVIKPFEDRELHVATMMALIKHRAFRQLDRKVQERTEELVRTEARFKQMAALADLGVFALRSETLQAVLDRAVSLAAATLGADFCQVYELSLDATYFRLQAAFGIEEQVWRSTTVEIDRRSQAGFTLLSGAPVVMEDAQTEERFRPPPMMLELGVVSGVSVIIHKPGDRRPHGVLGAHTRTRRDFAANEIAFLQAVANLVGTTVARFKAEEQRLEAERRAEEERVRAVHVEQELQVRDEFLTVAAHELRTPLTALHLQLKVLSAGMARLDEKMATTLRRATRSSDRLSALVATLLDVSRLSRGRLELAVAPVVLQEVVKETLDAVKELAQRAGCALRWEDAAGTPLNGQWDRRRVEQVLLNLLSNAFKYGAGKPVEVTLRKADGHAELEVRDHGPGLTPEQIARVFGRFERAVPVEHYGGLGLGLYISREVAEAHGGSVEVESTPGDGARFVIRLPLKNGDRLL